MRLAPLLLALAVTAPALAASRETRIPDAALATAAQLRERALADRTGWNVVESLTTEIGPRLAGSDADAKAVAWAQAKFKALGFDKVWIEPVTFPKSKGRGWHAYVEAPRLEITCGEAPFVCSRYDTVTGDELPVGERVGFLDRKLRIVTEKAKTRKEWGCRALDALRAT